MLEEISRLAARGVHEINLVAQDLAAYGWDWDGKSHFAQLLRKINALEGDFSVRLLYIHPDWMTDEIIETVSSCSKVLHYFDIPFQHASGPDEKNGQRRLVYRADFKNQKGHSRCRHTNYDHARLPGRL